jgi:hypothetical protein
MITAAKKLIAIIGGGTALPGLFPRHAYHSAEKILHKKRAASFEAAPGITIMEF